MRKNIDAINQRFRQAGVVILNMRWAVLLVIAAITVFAGGGLPKLNLDTSEDSLFLPDDPLTLARHEFNDIFGNDQYVGILVETDDVFAPESLRMMRELGETLLDEVPYTAELVALTDFDFTKGTEEGVEIVNIVPDDIPDDPQAIEAIRDLAFSKEFLVNRIFSDDSRQAWLFLRLEEFPEDWKTTTGIFPKNEVGEAVLTIIGQDKYQPYSLKASGSPIVSYEEGLFFARETTKLVGLSLLVALGVLLLFLRTLQGVVIPSFIFAIALIWVFGAMGHLSINVDSIVMSLPIYFAIVISIGYSIHMFNFFTRAFSGSGNRRAAVLYAIEETGWPVFFTSVTTIGALCSFYVVSVKRVRWMGLTSAAVVASVYLLIITLAPVLLSFGKNLQVQKQDKSDPTRVAQTAWSEQFFGRLSHWILAHSRAIVVIFILVSLALASGLPLLSVSMNYEKTYGLQVPYIKTAYEVGYSKIGSMYAYDVILTFDEPGTAKEPDILKNFDALIAEVKTFDMTTRVSSLLDVLKDMNQMMHENDPAYYRVPDSRELIAQLLMLYEIANGTEQEHWVDYDYSILRLMVEVKDFDTARMEQELTRLNNLIAELFPEAELSMVGTTIQFSVMQNYVAQGEVKSCIIALVVISVLMMLVFQSVTLGLIGLIPNLTPVVVVLGLMGYLDIPLDMTTMAIVPILLGLAVDDTIHFINHCKLEFQRNSRYSLAIHRTFRTVGKAIFLTSFILITSFATYLTSTTNFLFHLGLLLMCGVLSALLADYFMTPVLIYWTKPFGKEQTEL